MGVKEANLSSVLCMNVEVFVSFAMLLQKMFLVCLVWRRRFGLVSLQLQRTPPSTEKSTTQARFRILAPLFRFPQP